MYNERGESRFRREAWGESDKRDITLKVEGERKYSGNEHGH